MADDHTQRPYRSNGPAGAPGGGQGGNDPLAELARLIGQNDPFSEFGRDGGRRANPPAANPPPAPNWPPQSRSAAPPQTVAPPLAGLPLGATPASQPPLFGSPAFGRQPFGGELYQVESEAPAYGAPANGVPGNSMHGYAQEPGHAEFEHDAYQAAPGEYPAHDEFYDDEPPSRRRIGILAIAGIFALAVIGTAGAFGYRAIFGSTSVSGPPPVIKADTAKSKIVPASASKDAQANKMITERVNERGQGEKLVSREEQPVSVASTIPGSNPFPPDQNGAALPQLGSGIVGAEPKRIRTIAIHPDQPNGGASAPEPAVQPPPAQQPRVVNAPVRQANPPPPAPRAAVTAPPVQHTAVARAAPAPANAPLSLSPNDASPQPAQQPARAAAPQRTAAPPTRVATAPAANASSGGGGYAVQVSSQRSEADAQAAFRSLQGKFPDQLGSRQALIKRVDLGDKGIYFRAMVGPFGSSGEAGDLCSKLKSAGGSCLVQRN